MDTTMAPAVSLPEPQAIPTAMVGFLLLGICTSLGTMPTVEALESGPRVLGATVGPLLITAPTLFVAHHLMDGAGSPSVLAEALGEGLGRAGALALGLVPLVLFLSATSGLGMFVGVAAVLGIGAWGLVLVARTIARIEGGGLRGFWLASGWAGLTGAIALRILLDGGV